MEKQLPEKGFQILKGPSKFDLMLSIFDGKRVTLECQLGLEIVILTAQFRSIKFSDSDIYEETLLGNLKEQRFYVLWMGEIVFVEEYGPEPRVYYYSTHSQLGWICDKSSKVWM